MRLDTRALAATGAAFLTLSFPTPGVAAEPVLDLRVADATVAAGEPLVLSGAAGGLPAGSRIALEYRPRGTEGYRVVAAAPIGIDGRWSLRVAVPGTGAVRAALVDPAAASPRPEASRSLPRSILVRAGRSHLRPSPLTVTPLRVVRRKLDVTLGGRAIVAGTAPTGTTLRLERLAGGRWVVLDRARALGRRFSLRVEPRRTGSSLLRVRAGERVLRVGRLSVYRYAHASWYGPGLYGNLTSCGGRLHPGTLGVAHKTLPCGTKVTFRRAGRSVTVAVIDRGPFVGGREYDLTEAVAVRLGFRGHGPVLATR